MIFRRSRNPETLAETVAESPDVSVQIEQQIGAAALDLSRDRLANNVDGLKSELTKLDPLWDTINDTIDGFMDNPENLGLLRAAIVEYRHEHSERAPSKPHGRKLTDRDFDDFAKAHIALSRYSTFSNLLQQLERTQYKAPSMFSGSIQGFKEQRNARNRIEAKWQAVVHSACQHTPSATVFYDRVQNFGHSLKPLFNKHDKLANKVFDKTVGTLKNDPYAHLDFLNSLENLALSEEPHHRRFLELVAANHFGDEEMSLINLSLYTVAENANNDILLEQFLMEQANQHEGRNWVEFSRTLFHNGRHAGTFADYMSSVKSEWPEELNQQFEQFVPNFVSNLRFRVEQLMRQVVNPQMIAPAAYATEAMFDRLMRKTVGEPAQKAQQPVNYQSKGIVKPNLDNVLPYTQTESIRTKRLEIRWLSPSGDGYTFDENGGLKRRILDLRDSVRHEERYEADINKMLDCIAEKPFGPGRISLPQVSEVRLGGKKYKIMRLKPIDVPGLSVGETAKKSRIMYIVAERKVGILQIFTNHRDYDDFKNNRRR